MFYYLISSVFVRAAGAGLLSLALSLWMGKVFIKKFKGEGWVDYVRLYTPDSHKTKKGIPVTGGIFIIASLMIALLFFANLKSRFLLLSLLVIFFLALVGFLDDAIKARKSSSRGLKTRYRLLIQFVFASLVAFYLYYQPGFSKYLNIPFVGVSLNIGWLYVPLVIAIIIATPNSVNLTDGLDGLAAGCTLAAGVSYAFLAYLAGGSLFFHYLHISYVSGASELVVFWGALIGATSGFLWYNSYPARVFMGETGAQALGGALAITAILIKQEILLILIGGIFVIETLSVFLQVFFFQVKGKRILKISPLHHHYELKGVEEPKIVVHFWMLAVLLALLGLSSLLISGKW